MIEATSSQLDAKRELAEGAKENLLLRLIIFSAANDLLLPSAVSETMSSAVKIKPLVVVSLLIIVAALD